MLLLDILLSVFNNTIVYFPPRPPQVPVILDAQSLCKRCKYTVVLSSPSQYVLCNI